MAAIDPLTAGGVLLATAATDAVYVMFTSAVVARRRVPAATWSSIWYLLSSYAVISYTENWCMSPSRPSVHGWARLSRSRTCIGHRAVRRSAPRLSSFTVIASASDRPTLDRHTPRMRGKGYPVRRGLSVQSLTPLEYWVARSSRAMTSESVARSYSLHMSPPSRGAMRPRFCMDRSPDRGRRESRVLSAPAASRATKNKAHERSHHRFTGISPGLPRAMVLRLIPCSPR
jgi:hypothetical protein